MALLLLVFFSLVALLYSFSPCLSLPHGSSRLWLFSIWLFLLTTLPPLVALLLVALSFTDPPPLVALRLVPPFTCISTLWVFNLRFSPLWLSPLVAPPPVVLFLCGSSSSGSLSLCGSTLRRVSLCLIRIALSAHLFWLLLLWLLSPWLFLAAPLPLHARLPPAAIILRADEASAQAKLCAGPKTTSSRGLNTRPAAPTPFIHLSPAAPLLVFDAAVTEFLRGLLFLEFLLLLLLLLVVLLLDFFCFCFCFFFCCCCCSPRPFIHLFPAPLLLMLLCTGLPPLAAAVTGAGAGVLLCLLLPLLLAQAGHTLLVQWWFSFFC